MGALVREVSTFWQRAIRDGDGVRWATVRRARELLGIELVEARLATATCEPAIATLERQIGQLKSELQHLQEANTVTLEGTVRRDFEALDERLTFTEWIESAPLPRTPLVTIIMASLGQRPVSLRRALLSVREQNYQHYEVLLATPRAGLLPAEFASDARFREVIHAGSGVSAARNAGLRAAKGEFVTYADDDNIVGPHWLRAVAWAFTTDSDVDVVYGARLHEQLSRDPAAPPAFWWFERTWDPQLLQQYSPIDTQTLAHRAGLPEARWDEQLSSCVDWDIAIRLTASGRVRPLPVRACTYTTGDVGRITHQANNADVQRELRRRARAARCLNVLGITHSFPRHSEHYIESELSALGPTFRVCIANEYEPDPGAWSSFEHLGDARLAMRTHRPDLVLFHFADVAARLQPVTTELGIPYAVRVHSYDLELASRHPFHDDPNCLGLWVYPQHTSSVPNARSLPALVHDAHRHPAAPSVRSGVVVASACLPKRDWEELVDIFGGLPGVERSILLATCHGHEAMPPEIAALLEEVDPRIQTRIDVANHEVLRLLSVASTMLYLPSLNHVVGNPRSIIEAWLCGTIPIVADSPEMRCFAGDHARYYVHPSEAIELVRALNVAGDSLDGERSANHEFAVQRHASPAVFDQFARELRQTFSEWEERVA